MRRLLVVAAALAALGCTCGRDQLAIDPKAQIEGMYLRATTEYLDGNFEQALAGFEEVRKLSPSDPRLPAAIGEVYLTQGKLPEAEKQFREAVQLDPKRGTNWSRLGFILAQRGQREEARQALEKAVEISGNDFNALENLGELAAREGDVDGAVKLLARSAEVSPEPLKPALYLRASALLVKANRRPEAILVLQEAVGKGGGSAEVLGELGDLQVRERDFTGALKSYEAAARLAPEDPTYWELVGELYLARDRPGDALNAYRESLKIANRAVVHVALARLHLARGEKDAAQEELQKALDAATGDDPQESVALAELLAQMGRKPDALKLLEVLAADETFAADVQLQLRTARLARELGQKATVSAACERVAKVDAGTPLRCP